MVVEIAHARLSTRREQRDNSRLGRREELWGHLTRVHARGRHLVHAEH
jgi:hypothetical protein